MTICRTEAEAAAAGAADGTKDPRLSQETADLVAALLSASAGPALRTLMTC
jgi:hypothetical protein